MKRLRQLEFYLEQDIEYFKKRKEEAILETSKIHYESFTEALEYVTKLIDIVRKL